MTAAEASAAIAAAVARWPGPVSLIACELQCSERQLAGWRNYSPSERQRAPRESDVVAIKAAVRRLLLRALEQLDNPELEPDHWTRRGTPPGARHGNAVPKKDRQNAVAADIPGEST